MPALAKMGPAYAAETAEVGDQVSLGLAGAHWATDSAHGPASRASRSWPRVRPETYPSEVHPFGSRGGTADYRMGYRALRGGEDLGLYRSRADARAVLDGGQRERVNEDEPTPIHSHRNQRVALRATSRKAIA